MPRRRPKGDFLRLVCVGGRPVVSLNAVQGIAIGSERSESSGDATLAAGLALSAPSDRPAPAGWDRLENVL